nr:probable G-protein coupled receptor B0563.6 [Penaeus vannamei]
MRDILGPISTPKQTGQGTYEGESTRNRQAQPTGSHEDTLEIEDYRKPAGEMTSTSSKSTDHLLKLLSTASSPPRHPTGELIHRKERNEWLVDSIWFQVYKWILELFLKLLPALVLVYLNVRIIRTYKAVCEKRRKMTKKVSGEQRRQYAEESRLMYLLGGTSTLFFVCMTPMIVLSVTIHRPWKNSLAFEIFRAIANVLEVTNFAVTFYIYCTFSKDFRETFLRTLRSAKENSMGASFLGSVSGLKEAIRPP